MKGLTDTGWTADAMLHGPVKISFYLYRERLLLHNWNPFIFDHRILFHQINKNKKRSQCIDLNINSCDTKNYYISILLGQTTILKYAPILKMYK